MSYCHKGFLAWAYDIDHYMSEDDIEFTLDSCEQNCDRYYGCDTVAYMEDKLKELRNE